MAKPVKYYICCDSEKQKEDAQDMLHNIKNKTRESYGQNLLNAVTFYNNYLNEKRGK